MTVDLEKLLASAAQAVEYPESDGEPVGETDFHIGAIFYLRQALRHFFRQTEQVYVAANMLFYYEEGNPASFKVPDVFVVKGIEAYDRRVYKLWEEQAVPCTVFEITSRSTRLEDLTTKKGLYELLGVAEYFIFDPLGEYLTPALQGFRRAEGYYRPVAPAADGTLRSEQLGLILKPELPRLRLVDPQTGEAIPTLDEAVDRLARLQAEVRRLRAQLKGED